MQTPNGVPWTGVSDRLSDGFTLTKPKGVHRHVAVCEVWTSPDGWELRLILDGRTQPTTTVVQTAGEKIALVETWRAALLDMGWI